MVPSKLGRGVGVEDKVYRGMSPVFRMRISAAEEEDAVVELEMREEEEHISSYG